LADDIDELDISVPVSSSAAVSRTSDETMLFVILAVIGGIALGWVIGEFARKALRQGGWNRGRYWGGRESFAPWGDDFRMMRRGVWSHEGPKGRWRGGRSRRQFPADYTRRDYYEDLESNHIRDIHQVIPQYRMTPLSPGYPAYVEKWNVYRDATGGIVDVGAGDF
jgi:hypothetical protein